MKTIIISTKHNWVEKIHLKIKTNEIRKTAPEAPFKVLIYDTKSSGGCGKVVSEFICNKVDEIRKYYECFKVVGESVGYTNSIAKGSCLDYKDMLLYLKNGVGYAIHISDLKIYSEPKELSEFKNLKGEPLKRAPQSWQHVEEE